MILGATFLGIKAVEYHDKYRDHLIPGRLIQEIPSSGRPRVALPVGVPVGNVELFYWIYFAMTGMHALHMIIGLGLMTWLTIKTCAAVLVRSTTRRLKSQDCIGTSWISFGSFVSVAYLLGDIWKDTSDDCGMRISDCGFLTSDF